MLETEGILESQSVREPWHDMSRPIYERLLLKKKARVGGLALSDAIIDQLSSDRDTAGEISEHMQVERRQSTSNFFSGMDIEELEDLSSAYK